MVTHAAGAHDAPGAEQADNPSAAPGPTIHSTAPDGSRFVFRSRVFDGPDLERALTRIAHEIAERNHGVEDVVLIGLYTRGVALARRLAIAANGFEPHEIPVGTLDISFHRDDYGLRVAAPQGPTEVPVDISGRVVVLVDDVLYTGRSARAAMEGVMELGRPRAVQLAVLVDRGHRELPIRADFVGKNLPTRHSEDVRVRLDEVDGEPDGVEIWGPSDADPGAEEGP